MSEHSGSGNSTVSPFLGLVPTRGAEESSTLRSRQHHDLRRAGRGISLGLAATMPIVLVGALALTVLAPNTDAPAHKDASNKKLRASDPATLDIDAASASDEVSASDIETASVVVPSTYTVKSGDTVSGIAGRYHLSTASVLALNGLSWSSLIFPKQVLRLTKATSTVTPPVTTTPAKTPPVTTPPASSTPPATTKPPVTTPPPVITSVSYTIRAGDTVTSIAKKYGVTVQAILTANHLVATSIIYTGRTLVIPTGTAPSSTGSSTGSSAGGTSSTAPASTGSTSVIVPLSSSMEVNAKTIIAVGKSLNVPSYGLVVALAAAMQESGLQDLSYGDRDSIGLFQQRPSAGWGTVTQLENTTYASELFFGGPKNPNKGKTRGLLDIPGWQSMTVTQAAQAVQISANPTAYAKWEASARAWVAQLG